MPGQTKRRLEAEQARHRHMTRWIEKLTQREGEEVPDSLGKPSDKQGQEIARDHARHQRHGRGGHRHVYAQPEVPGDQRATEKADLASFQFWKRYSTSRCTMRPISPTSSSSGLCST